MRNVRNRLLTVTALAAIVGALATSGLSSAGAAASFDDGVSAKSVKIGYIFSKTGVAGSTFLNADKGCQARIDRENAKGGVNGRKIDVTMVDDQSSAVNKTAAQDLVQNKHVFMIVNNSSFPSFFNTHKYLQEAKVPQVNGGFDGTYYGEPGNEDIISALGNVVAANGVTYDGLPNLMKAMGASKVAVVSYGASASSTAAAQNLQKFAVPAVPGMKAVYTNTAVDFGTTDVGPQVLGIKESGADAIYLPLVASSNIAIVQGLAQNGVKMKSTVLATGYGQPLLDEPVSKTFGPEVVLAAGFAPVELKTKATKRFVTDLKKVGYTGVPDFGVYTGYITCDLAILGIKNAGNPPTRAAFAPNLRKLKTYDQAGLGCRPIDISLETYGQASKVACAYYMKIKNGKFVLFPPPGKPATTPWTSKLIEESTVATTTTTAPPA